MEVKWSAHAPTKKDEERREMRKGKGKKKDRNLQRESKGVVCRLHKSNSIQDVHKYTYTCSSFDFPFLPLLFHFGLEATLILKDPLFYISQFKICEECACFARQ
ncbi:hypothetical protein, unlikely [Trypanosoma brucei gambiense DAL972]|uniref:Uncharacterized protein n=1 Tax=Trypanosoma brucei gambiense (strain MHOM/CI/86/DAL972) TaxID=679716 RepID=C9ZRZ6_TRYB9|nr:hypothetical protein, unlikely [Trypanosoma brucei gambiense DAL972]CBH12132.1 hypothetical protein, unlikely [Trypanosoma brucei gambiense DAL972]|eukprot:XP_011774415.1 hypothetical protein, unlikely [Trypanosoma brucei gambiense DAL972]